MKTALASSICPNLFLSTIILAFHILGKRNLKLKGIKYWATFCASRKFMYRTSSNIYNLGINTIESTDLPRAPQEANMPDQLQVAKISRKAILRL
jgi:hypothetical protein